MRQEVTTIETLKERIVPKLKHFVDSAPFGFTIMLLILLSVALIVIESFVDLSPQALDYVRFVNDDILLWVFIVELFLRWVVSPSTKYFFSNYWIDILAVVPVSSVPIFRILRLGRVLRILRVLRLFRVFSIGSEFTRKFKFLSKIFEGRLTEIGIISSFALFAIFFSKKSCI